jgi:hypothetical protein
MPASHSRLGAYVVCVLLVMRMQLMNLQTVESEFISVPIMQGLPKVLAG